LARKAGQPHEPPFDFRCFAADHAGPPRSDPLEVVSLVKRFGSVTAVDGISIELRGGECLGLLGQTEPARAH